MSDKVVPLLAFSGRKQSGKDTLADYVRTQIDHDRGCWRGCWTSIIKFADPLKVFCVDYLDVPFDLVYGTDDRRNQLVPHLLWENFPVHDPYRTRTGPMTGREVTQYWPTEIMRAGYPGIWLNKTRVNIIDALRVDAIVLNSDCRFPYEVDLIHELGGKVIRLTRSPLQDDHVSEHALDPEVYDWSNFDYVLDNANMTVEEQQAVVTPILIEWGFLANDE